MMRALSILVLAAALLPRLASAETAQPAAPAPTAQTAAEGGLIPVPTHAAPAGTNAVSQTVRYVTYRQACLEGWAPKPTNSIQRDIQKSVLAERRQGPTNPILIKPGQKPRATSK
jgi:hypothetical protein